MGQERGWLHMSLLPSVLARDLCPGLARGWHQAEEGRSVPVPSATEGGSWGAEGEARRPYTSRARG